MNEERPARHIGSFRQAWEAWRYGPCKSQLIPFVLPLLLVVGPPQAVAAASDPLPIQYVPIKVEQLPAEMERMRQGLLLQLPRAEFDRLLRRAAEARASNPPRLLETAYRATLNGTALEGSADWKLIHSEATPGVLGLQPLNLAMRHARLRDQDAVIGDFDGKTPGVLVDQAGGQSFTFRWTARGEARPSGLHFDLELPACPISALTLELPEVYRIALSSDGCLLEGPGELDATGKRLWTIRFARRTQLHLTLERGDGGRPRTLILARLRATQDLMPDSIDAVFDFGLEALHQAARTLVVELGPGLIPYDVAIPNLDRWFVGRPEWAGALGGAIPQNIVVIRLREGLKAGTLQIRCQAPLHGSGSRREPDTWVSPGVHLQGSVSAGETLILRLHPDVQITDWQSGPFQLVEASTSEDGSQVLTLKGGGIASYEGKSRPSAAPANAGIGLPRAAVLQLANGTDRVHSYDLGHLRSEPRTPATACALSFRMAGKWTR